MTWSLTCSRSHDATSLGDFVRITSGQASGDVSQEKEGSDVRWVDEIAPFTAHLPFVSQADPPPSRAAWDLDPAFFKALSRWTLDNPKVNSDEVVQHIFDGVLDCTELLDCIPDSPFPVRTLVKALSSLVKASTVCRLINLIYPCT